MNKLVLLGLGVVSLAGAFYLGRWTAPLAAPTYPLVFATPALSTRSTGQNVPQDFLVEPARSIVQIDVQPNAQIPAIQTNPGSYRSDWQLMQSLIELGKTAPEAALEQTRQLKGELQLQAQTAILGTWGQTNPALAWRWLESNQPLNSQSFIALIGTMAMAQPNATLDLADSYAISQPLIKKDIYQAAIEGMVRGGHYDSAVFLLDYLDTADGGKQDLTRALVDQWVTYQPQAALEWLAQLPLPRDEIPVGRAGAVATEITPDQARQQHNELLESTYEHWLGADINGAASWLTSQPPLPALDGLFSRLSGQLANDPARALAAAGRIYDHQLKLNTLLSVLSPIKQRDPAQANAYIQQLDYLNDSQRNSLRRELALPN